MKMLFVMTIVLALPAWAAGDVCPSSPNCVASLVSGSKFIEPFPVSGDGREDFVLLHKILLERKDTTITAADEERITVEFKTALGFVDDGLFVLDQKMKGIQVRSASRSGYWDMGKNRRRLETIRREYLARRP